MDLSKIKKALKVAFCKHDFRFSSAKTNKQGQLKKLYFCTKCNKKEIR